MSEMTVKQQKVIERLRSKWGDETLLRYAQTGKYKNYCFVLDNLSKEEAQVIITKAPYEPIKGIHAPISLVQSL